MKKSHLNKLKIFRLLLLISMLTFFAFSIKRPQTDAEGRPMIKKIGTIDCDMVETTPVVFKDKVYRFEYVRANYWNNQTGDSFFRFIDHSTGNPTTSFAKGFHFGSAFVLDGTVYVTAVDRGDGERLFIFASHGFSMSYYYFKTFKKRTQDIPEDKLVLKEYPVVTIQLPLYNER